MRERTPDFTKSGLDPKVALDAIFRRNVLTRPGALALCDPSDRATFTDGLPRRLNYAEADVAVNRIAAQMKALGLPEGSTVALQLPNTVEAVLSLLAVLRAGLVAVPVPVLWRRADLVAALREINARAIVTMTRIGSERPVEIACEAAAELFSLGFPCAFGHDVPDGVIPLDLDAPIPSQKADLPSIRIPAADKAAIVTFDASRRGAFAVGRSHTQWIAAGCAVMLEARIASGETIVSTLPPASLAGIASTFVPWLLTGGTLALVHGYSPPALAQAASAGAHLVAPTPALPALSNAGAESFATCIAVHRGPHSLGVDLSQTNCEAIVDVQSFGEIGLVALRRIAKIMPSPVPIGETRAPADAPSAPVVIETKRLADGTLAVRGAMVPDKAFPDSAREASQIEFDLDGFVRTNLRCHAIGSCGLVIEAPPDGIIAIGGLRYGIDDLTMRIAKASPGSTLETGLDSLLGTRIAIEGNDPPAARKALDEAGQSRLIFGDTKLRVAERRAG